MQQVFKVWLVVHQSNVKHKVNKRKTWKKRIWEIKKERKNAL